MNRPAAKGTFLIAAPSLYDPNFRQTVVLLCEHNDKGSMGLVINRPTELVLTEALRQLALPDRDDVIYRGGPVQPDHLLILIRSDQSPSSAHHVFGAVYLGADVPTLQSLAARNTGDDAPAAPANAAFRGYAGYTGWGAGQLDCAGGRAGRSPYGGLRRGFLRRSASLGRRPAALLAAMAASQHALGRHGADGR